jgi:hypothetical protein
VTEPHVKGSYEALGSDRGLCKESPDPITSNSPEGMTSYSTFFHFFIEPLMAAAMTCVVFWGARWTQTKTPLGPAKVALAFLILWIAEFLAVLAHDYLFASHDSYGDRVLFRVLGAFIGIVIILSTRNFWDWPEQ